MARRHRLPESDNTNRWMVSYADLMTLLFAFFVVLFASSSIDRGKFSQMSQAFVSVFDQPRVVAIPQDVQTLIQDLSDSFSSITDISSEPQETQLHLLELLIQVVNSTLEIPDPVITQTYEFVQLTLPADRLFELRSNEISESGNGFISAFAKLVRQTDRFILIEVFSDDQVEEQAPWLLSAKQGMAITELLLFESVSPMHMASVNYGPFHPVATNDDEEGQGLNRRVNFVIYPNLQHLNRLNTMAKEQKSAKPNK